MRLKRTVLVPAAVALATASLAVAVSNGFREQAERIDSLAPSGPGPLDGMVFNGMLGLEGKPKDVEDTFVFANGTFVSKECETRCDYPARPYKAKKVEKGWRFESITRCPYKDATIAWRGTIKNGRVEGAATWTLRRWYWTIEREFAFEAELASQSQRVAEDG